MCARVVYSTGAGRMCPDCGEPAAVCRCSQVATGHEQVPDRVTAKLRLESHGRGGKSVTVIFGLPDNTDFLKQLAAALKSACGTGGTVKPGVVELAGDVRARVRPLLEARGMRVKG